MYKFMTPQELAKAIAIAPFNTEFDFTFDSEEDIKVRLEPEGWYGAKITTIFDEYDGIFAIGYHGGQLTRCYDLYAEDCFDKEETIKKLTQWINDFFVIAPENYYGKVCVEITEDNKKYLED